LGIPLGQCEIGRFPDGEIKLRVSENVRGVNVYVIQPTNAPAENLLELLILLDALKRASAASITAIIPFLGMHAKTVKPARVSRSVPNSLPTWLP